MANKVETYWGEQWEKVVIPKKTTNTDYFISNFGRVKSVDQISTRERLVKGSVKIWLGTSFCGR